MRIKIRLRRRGDEDEGYRAFGQARTMPPPPPPQLLPPPQLIPPPSEYDAIPLPLPVEHPSPTIEDVIAPLGWGYSPAISIFYDHADITRRIHTDDERVQTYVDIATYEGMGVAQRMIRDYIIDQVGPPRAKGE